MTRNTKKAPHAENEILAERFPDKFRFELTELKRAGNQQKKYDDSLLVKWLGNDPLSTNQFKKRIQDETGMSRATFFRLLAEAEKQKRIVYNGAHSMRRFALTRSRRSSLIMSSSNSR